jgi:hypothetical protein
MRDGEPLTLEAIAEMSESQINARWPQVSEALAANRHAADDGDESTDVSTAGERKPTGQQLLSEHKTGPVPLSWGFLKDMTLAEYEARKDEVDTFAARGGRAA